MSTTSSNPTSPILRRDVRSDSISTKRDKNHSHKWSNGMRPSAGVRHDWVNDELIGGSPSQQEKVRPRKQWSQVSSEYKTHANRNPKPTFHSANYFSNTANTRLDRKVDALLDVNDHTSSPLSKSLLELLPQHTNNTNSAIQTAIATEAGVLYSFDSKSSPGAKANSVALESLVDLAEKKYKADQTTKIVSEEYEVLDTQGETTILNAKGKKKGSPKQRAKAAARALDLEKDDLDGFELV